MNAAGAIVEVVRGRREDAVEELVLKERGCMVLRTADNLAEKRNGIARMKKMPKNSAAQLRRKRPLVKDGPASLEYCLKHEP